MGFNRNNFDWFSDDDDSILCGNNTFKQVEDTIPMNHPWQMDNAARKMRLMGWDLRTVLLHASKRNRISPRKKEAAQEIHLNSTTLWLKSSIENATTKAKMMASWVKTRPYTWNYNKFIGGCLYRTRCLTFLMNDNLMLASSNLQIEASFLSPASASAFNWVVFIVFKGFATECSLGRASLSLFQI